MDVQAYFREHSKCFQLRPGVSAVQVKALLQSSDKSTRFCGRALDVSRIGLTMVVMAVAGSISPPDVSSRRDEVKSRELDWLIDRREDLFWHMQNIHICSLIKLGLVVSE